MRHGDKINNLGRTASHRKAMLKNLSCALIMNKRITTTLAKAKALRRHIEPLMTKTKGISTEVTLMHKQRLVFSLLQNEQATQELFIVVAPKIAKRPGGYCRIIKLGRRKSDSAEMAYMELVDFNEIYKQKSGNGTEQEATTKKTRTRRSGSTKKTVAKPAEAQQDNKTTTAPDSAMVEEHKPSLEKTVAKPAEEQQDNKTTSAPDSVMVEEHKPSLEKTASESSSPISEENISSSDGTAEKEPKT